MNETNFSINNKFFVNLYICIDVIYKILAFIDVEINFKIS